MPKPRTFGSHIKQEINHLNDKAELLKKTLKYGPIDKKDMKKKPKGNVIQFLYKHYANNSNEQFGVY